MSLPGIIHFIVDDKKVLDRDRVYQRIKALLDRTSYEAFDLMFYNFEDNFLIPLVYVKATDSLYWEMSCASGTAALGSYLAYRENSSLKKKIPQPGGLLEVEVLLREGKIEELYLDGPIEIVAEGMVYIDL